MELHIAATYVQQTSIQKAMDSLAPNCFEDPYIPYITCIYIYIYTYIIYIDLDWLILIYRMSPVGQKITTTIKNEVALAELEPKITPA